jgi:hypothetical protein
MVAARSSCKHLSLSAPIRFWHWLMPPTARGAVGAVAPDDGDGMTEGACDGVTDGNCEGVSDGDCEGVSDCDCEGVTDGDCEGAVAGVSEGVMLGGVKPYCGCAKAAALASASNVAEAINLRVIAFSVKGMSVPPPQAACHPVA